MIDQIILFFASYIANTMSAFAGGGAGLVQFPALILLGLPFSVALATHKVATVALGLGATYRYIRHKAPIDWGFAASIMAVGITGTILGAYIVVQIPAWIGQILLGVLTISLGIFSLFKKEMGQENTPKNRDAKGLAIGTMGIFLIGVFNGSLTSGSGLFLTILLILWFGLDYKNAVMYTMTLVGVFWNATGALSIVAFGQSIQWDWVPVLLLGSFLGGYTGAYFAYLKGNKWIKYAFVSVTIASGTFLIIKFFL